MKVLEQTQLGLNMPCSPDSAITVPDAELHYFPEAFSQLESDDFLEYCLRELPWRQDDIVIAGKRMPIPRLQNWFGDSDRLYSYSGISLQPLPWTEKLLRIRERVECLCGRQFNSVLANQYRDGRDSVAWHSDDESELGCRPVIASVSFGVTRMFELRHMRDRAFKSLRLPLHHGSLLIMGGDMQHHWQHQIPKEKWVELARVNLTFRCIISTIEKGRHGPF